MGLFGRKKENDEHKQTLEIKQATTQQQEPISQTTQQNFLNPFAQQQNSSNSQSNTQMQNPTQNFNAPIPNFEVQQTPQTNQNPNQFPQNNQEQPNNPMNPFENSNTVNPTNISQFNQQLGVENNFEETQKSQTSLTKDEIQEMIDETVEKIIEDKWDKLVENVAKIVNWKEKQEAQVNMLKEDIVAIKDNFEKIEKKLMNKVNDYDRNILDVNSEIKALEKVFQKITPTLVNNVNELSKIANDLRESKSDKIKNPQLDKE